MPFSPNRPIRVLYDGSHWWRCLKIKYHNFCHIREYCCWFVFDTPPPLPPMPWAMFIALAHWLNLSAVPCDGLETSKEMIAIFLSTRTRHSCWSVGRAQKFIIVLLLWAVACLVSNCPAHQVRANTQNTWVNMPMPRSISKLDRWRLSNCYVAMILFAMCGGGMEFMESPRTLSTIVNDNIRRKKKKKRDAPQYNHFAICMRVRFFFNFRVYEWMLGSLARAMLLFYLLAIIRSSWIAFACIVRTLVQQQSLVCRRKEEDLWRKNPR